MNRRTGNRCAVTREDLLAHMRRLYACSEATSWVRSQSGSAYDLWRRCDRGDWLLWLASRAGVDRRLVVLSACDCVEPVLAYVPCDDDRPRVAIETARRWARGEATIDDVCAAYDAARAAAADAADAADAAAYDAARAVAADAAADAAAYAAAATAAAAATYAAYAPTYARSLAESARLVRRRIPWGTVRDALDVV